MDKKNVPARRTRTAALTILLLVIGLAGCEPMVLNEGEAVNSDVSGTWSYADTVGGRSTWTLTQADDATIDGLGTASETIVGNVSGDSIRMIVTYSTNSTATLSGTVTDVAGTMAGTFTNTLSGQGAWTAWKME